MKQHYIMHSTASNENKFDTYLTYDLLFKQYIQSITDINNKALSHWKFLQSETEHVKDFSDLLMC